jgi:hypothetical protein
MAILSEADVRELLTRARAWYSKNIKGDKHYPNPLNEHQRQRNAHSASSVAIVNAARAHAAANNLSGSDYGRYLVAAGIKAGNSEEMAAVTLHCAHEYFRGASRRAIERK